MLKKVALCNICYSHIENGEQGKAFFISYLDLDGGCSVGRVSERIFDRTCENDLHLCNRCMASINLQNLFERK